MVDLPAPDSPISPSTRPFSRVKETPWTMVMSFGGSPGGYAVAPILRSRTSSRSAIATPSLQAGSAVQQPVDHQVDADREGGDGRPGDGRGGNAENDAVLVVLHDSAQIGRAHV